MDDRVDLIPTFGGPDPLGYALKMEQAHILACAQGMVEVDPYKVYLILLELELDAVRQEYLSDMRRRGLHDPSAESGHSDPSQITVPTPELLCLARRRTRNGAYHD